MPRNATGKILHIVLRDMLDRPRILTPAIPKDRTREEPTHRESGSE